MTWRQFAHLPLLLVVLALALPACIAAVVLRWTMALIRYLHRVYMPELYRQRRYVEQDTAFTHGLYQPYWEPIICTIPEDEHGWVDLPGGFSGHVPCNGWPRIDCPVHPDSGFADRPGQKIVDAANGITP